MHEEAVYFLPVKAFFLNSGWVAQFFIDHFLPFWADQAGWEFDSVFF